MEKNISFSGIGTVTLRKSRRARKISIRISQQGEVKVTVPYVVSFQEGIAFLEKKKSWVLRTLQKIRQEKPAVRTYKPGENPFTRQHKLLLTPARGDYFNGTMDEEVTRISYPSFLSTDHPQLKAFIGKMYIETLRAEALFHLPARVSWLAKQHGYQYRRVYLKNMKSRWGSCSAALNINLNIHLMMLPEYLIDYVILHELVHTVHKNHGPGFWHELDRLTGHAKALDKELNNYRIDVDGMIG